MAEQKLIAALYGPFSGLVKVDADIAEQGIKDGWARDPFEPYEPPKDFDMAKALAAADKAARKIRGEEEPPPKQQKKPKVTPAEAESAKAEAVRDEDQPEPVKEAEETVEEEENPDETKTEVTERPGSTYRTTDVKRGGRPRRR